MPRELIFQLISVLISIAVFAITRYLVPGIREWIRGTQLEQVLKWTGQAVLAVEQMYGAAYTGKERKAIVTSFLKRMLLHKNITLSDEELEMLIEAAVKQMNMDDFPYLTVGEEEKTEK